jgi:hypothetical protein
MNTAINAGTTSELAVIRLRGHRLARKLTQKAAARGITECGYKISRDSLAHAERGRLKSFPVELLDAAAFFYTHGNVGSFLHGPYCPRCGDRPPRWFTCNTCGKSGDEREAE